MKKVVKIVLIVFGALFVIGFISNLAKVGKATKAVNDSTKVQVSGTDPKEGEAAVASAWRYSEDEDKMTSDKVYHAEVDANELLQFEFPYQGGSTATLYLRNKNKKNNLLLMVSKGQFNSSFQGQNIKVRFDDDKPMTFGTSNANDGDTKVLFIDNVSKFIARMKTAKKVLIEAEFYRSGVRQMEFNVSGFNWAH
ncbi:hypothetical protein [Chitinophaga flava]|uniref:Uncharacterized protein n=1 Tax=Chitinophaga flava TaxID=2259036 RepID=A0A365Y1C5_9BACT|nr:hypothetical protein [Chitinophaga flava]RBL92413.1 hypothetical protein DF182_07475 [Chitinophaga flava]